MFTRRWAMSACMASRRCSPNGEQCQRVRSVGDVHQAVSRRCSPDGEQCERVRPAEDVHETVSNASVYGQQEMFTRRWAMLACKVSWRCSPDGEQCQRVRSAGDVHQTVNNASVYGQQKMFTRRWAMAACTVSRRCSPDCEQCQRVRLAGDVHQRVSWLQKLVLHCYAGPHWAFLHSALVSLHSAKVDEWLADDVMAGHTENELCSSYSQLCL